MRGLGLSDKETRVYLSLLSNGPSSVRNLSQTAEVNRGTTYDILKSLQAQGLVSYYDQEKKTYFVAEDPEKLSKLLADREGEIKSLRDQLDTVVPGLKSVAAKCDKAKPVARYFYGAKGIRSILLEVLDDVKKMSEKKYHVYSSTAISSHLYESIPDFTEQRIKEQIFVSVISLGDGGSSDEQLSERRWLIKDDTAATYTIIFGDKTAFLSLDEDGKPHGVILDDTNLAQTQRQIFESLWPSLKQK